MAEPTYNHDLWTWIANKLWAVAIGIAAGVLTIGRWVSSYLNEHERRIGQLEIETRHLHECMHEQRDMLRETRDLTQRIAGKLGVAEQ